MNSIKSVSHTIWYCPDCGEELKVIESGISSQLITAVCDYCEQSWYGLREDAESLFRYEPEK